MQTSKITFSRVLFPFPFIAMSLLTGCASEKEKIAQLQAEAAAAAASAEKWKAFWSTASTIAIASIVAVLIYLTLRYFSAANTSKRLLRAKHDYVRGLGVLLKAGDYHRLQAAIRNIGLPKLIQGEFDLAASKLTTVYVLFRDKRNTFIPDLVKRDMLQSTQHTFEGLFSMIQRIKILQESHPDMVTSAAALDRICTNVRSINQRLDVCLRDTTELILPTLPTAAPNKSEQAVSSLENMLGALKEADRLLSE